MSKMRDGINYMTTVLAMCIHSKGDNPIFGETSTRIELDDEGGGPFLKISQVHDQIKPGEITVTIEELSALLAAGEALMKGWPDE